MLTPIIVPNFSDCEYNCPTKPPSAFEWYSHSGLLRTYLNMVHCLLMCNHLLSSCITPFAWGTHGIVSENLLHLTNGSRSRIFKLLAKCKAISLLKFFNSFTKIKIRWLFKTTSSFVGQRLTLFASGKKFTTAPELH